METDFELDSEYGFEELYEAIGVETEAEQIQTKTGIYRRVGESIDATGSANIYDEPEILEAAGNAVASMYAHSAEMVNESVGLDDEFYELGIEERLEVIDDNPGVLDHLT